MPGQQDYIKLELKTYKKKAKNFLNYSAEKYFIKRKFGVGEDTDVDKLRHYQLISSILESEETQLVDWVYNKINGIEEQEDCEDNYKNCPLDSCSVNECCSWDKIEW